MSDNATSCTITFMVLVSFIAVWFMQCGTPKRMCLTMFPTEGAIECVKAIEVPDDN